MVYSKPIRSRAKISRIVNRSEVLLSLRTRAGSWLSDNWCDCRFAAPHFAKSRRIFGRRAKRLGQHVFHRFDPLGRRPVGIIGIDHVEPVEHQSVGQGVDLGRQDLQALAGQCAGQFVEHPRRDVLAGADDVLHCPALAQVTARGMHVASLQRAQVLQLGGDLFGIRALEIGAGQSLDLPVVPGQIRRGLPGQRGTHRRSPPIGPVAGGRIAGQVPHRTPIQVDQDLAFPIVPHAWPDRRQVGRREHQQHVEHLGRADFDGEPHHDLVVAGIAAKRQVRHDQVLVDQELQRLGLAQRQAQQLGGLVGDPQPHFAMILDEALAQIVDQQRQVQGPLLLDLAIDAGRSVPCRRQIRSPARPPKCNARRRCICDIR